MVTAVATVCGTSVCSAQLTETQKATGVGALVGAAGGVAVGAAVHHPIAGTLIGAGVGGIGGYAVGSKLDELKGQNLQNRRMLQGQQAQINEQRREIQELQKENVAEAPDNENVAERVGNSKQFDSRLTE
jgi:phage tail tape-measure protein